MINIFKPPRPLSSLTLDELAAYARRGDRERAAAFDEVRRFLDVYSRFDDGSGVVYVRFGSSWRDEVVEAYLSWIERIAAIAAEKREETTCHQ